MIYATILFLILFVLFFYFFVIDPNSPIPYFPTQWRDLDWVADELLNVKDKRQKVKEKSKNNKLFPTISNQLQPIPTNHVIIDLGAGTGTVIFEAAKIAYKQQSIKQKILVKKSRRYDRRESQLRRSKANTIWDEEMTESAFFNRSNAVSTKFIAIEINPFLVWIMQVRRLLHPNRQNIQIIHADIFKININKLLTFHFSLLTLYLYVGPFVWDKLIPTLKTTPKNTRIISYMYQIPDWEKKLYQTKKGVKKMYIYKL